MQDPDDLVDHMPLWWCYKASKRIDALEAAKAGYPDNDTTCPHCGKPIT